MCAFCSDNKAYISDKTGMCECQSGLAYVGGLCVLLLPYITSASYSEDGNWLLINFNVEIANTNNITSVSQFLNASTITRLPDLSGVYVVWDKSTLENSILKIYLPSQRIPLSDIWVIGDLLKNSAAVKGVNALSAPSVMSGQYNLSFSLTGNEIVSILTYSSIVNCINELPIMAVIKNVR